MADMSGYNIAIRRIALIWPFAFTNPGEQPPLWPNTSTP